MKQRSIDFRELLQRLLPLDELPLSDRLSIHRALATGVGAQIEQVALAALGQLERAGALRRLPADERNPARVSYQRAGGADLITLQVPGSMRRDGFLLYPRASLPAQAAAGLDQVRRLLRLDDPSSFGDPRHADPRQTLITQLDQAGREFLGAHAVRLTLGSGDGDDRDLERTLAIEARRHPDCILYCPDLAGAGRTPPTERRSGESPRGARPGDASRAVPMAAAMAVTAVTASDGHVLATLEVSSLERDAFRLEDLSRMALLADYCARALERVERIEKLVFIDPLTQVYNRSYFDLQVQNEMARAQREQTSLGLVIADIDDFKSFNTAFGYEAGNEVLVQVAQALRGGVRPFDTVSRWGGEEFSILLSAPVQAEDVATVCERLRSLVERMPVRIEGLDRRSHKLGVTVSLGVALYPDHAENAQELWRAANQALLKAKRPPKNQVVFYSPATDSRSGLA
ncbi:MAG: GGDEF domain-containing protein [Candidatus Eiseniibacteriota bacterium]